MLREQGFSDPCVCHSAMSAECCEEDLNLHVLADNGV